MLKIMKITRELPDKTRKDFELTSLEIMQTAWEYDKICAYEDLHSYMLDYDKERDLTPEQENKIINIYINSKSDSDEWIELMKLAYDEIMDVKKSDVKNLIADYDILKSKLTPEELDYAEELIANHENGNCNCDLPDSDDYYPDEYRGYCMAGSFAEGQINAEQFIENIRTGV